MTQPPFARLLSWLGPWADAFAVPAGIERRELAWPRTRDDSSLRVLLYSRLNHAPIGSIVLAHGLHPLGAEDPRLDRFIRILANAGFLVAAPLLPDYLGLRCDGYVAHDFASAFDALRAQPQCPAGPTAVVSISYGSYPALRLLTDPERVDRVAGGVVFGGYGSPENTLRYSLGERPPGTPEPDLLSMPAVAINLVQELGLALSVTAPVQAAWLELARATWGKPQLKTRSAYTPVVHSLAVGLDAAQRELYMRGAGIAADSHAYFLSALERNQRLHTIDPRPHLASLQRPLHLMHGRADDVIPCTEIDMLFAACPKQAEVTRHLTGLYSHTASSSLSSQLRDARKLAAELLTFVQMLRALVRVASPKR